jgi:transcriptional regulator with XRE-family HTH domain
MLGEELRKAREAAGMTQERLAFEAGLDRPYISHLENNKKSPTVATLFRLCKALGVEASSIIAAVEHSQKPKARTRR